jgi:hypothetical protein
MKAKLENGTQDMDARDSCAGLDVGVCVDPGHEGQIYNVLY